MITVKTYFKLKSCFYSFNVSEFGLLLKFSRVACHVSLFLAFIDSAVDDCEIANKVNAINSDIIGRLLLHVPELFVAQRVRGRL
jgi:hypothetical protein